MIQGSGFSQNVSANVVTFGGIVAPVQSASASGLLVIVPQGAQTGNVTVTVDGVASAGVPFTVLPGAVSTGTTTGTVLPGAPQIYLVLPSSGAAFMPVGIGGKGFDSGTLPYVNGSPSVALFNFTTGQIPLIGPISIGFTIVPPGAPKGPGTVQVQYNGLMSAGYPFTVQ
jgi:hypothetical protein